MNEEPGARPSEHAGPAEALLTTPAIYVSSGFIYAVLCGPAIGQRGYPPIDPAWFAVTFLWVSAIPLSVVFDPRPFTRRFKGLALYCLVTAFVDAATFCGVVPRQVTLLETLVETVLIYGPMHLIVGMLVEWLAQGSRAGARAVCRRLSPRAARLGQWGSFFALILLTTAFPFAFRAYSFAELRRHGRTQAEQDWSAGLAELYVKDPAVVGRVTHHFDPATGLKIRRWFRESGYAEAYQARVVELLAEHGIPEWSMKKHIVADDDLVAMLDSDQMETVNAFPRDVNENITLLRQGTITRWGATMSSTSGLLAIATRREGLIGVGNGWGGSVSATHDSLSRVTGLGGGSGGRSGTGPAFVGRLPKYPGVIFIRSGTSWVGAFHEGAELLSWVDRGESPSGTANPRSK